MSWPTVRIKDVAEIINGRAYKKHEMLTEGKYPLMRVGNFFSNRGWYFSDLELPDKQYCDTGDLLYAWSASFGPRIWDGGKVIYHYHIWKLVLDESLVDKKYLFYVLQNDVDKIKQQQGTGSTMIHVTKVSMENREIPLPPLETQKQIAALLEKADQLRKDCQQMEQELNSLAQSVFIDMFGDPVTNPKGWELTYLPNHGSFKNGLNFSKDDSGVRLKYLGVGDFKSLSSISKLDHLGFVDVNSLPSDDYLLKNSDLVFVRSNGNKALVGRCISIYPDDVPVTFSGFCIRYRVESDSMEPEWLNYMLRTTSMKQAMLEGGQGANIQNINQKILSSLEIPLPPMDKQRLFCKAIESYRESLSQLKEYSQEINGLFNSLMQKAFKGELDL